MPLPACSRRLARIDIRLRRLPARNTVPTAGVRTCDRAPGCAVRRAIADTADLGALLAATPSRHYRTRVAEPCRPAPSASNWHYGGALNPSSSTNSVTRALSGMPAFSWSLVAARVRCCLWSLVSFAGVSPHIDSPRCRVGNWCTQMQPDVRAAQKLDADLISRKPPLGHPQTGKYRACCLGGAPASPNYFFGNVTFLPFRP